MTEQSSSVSPEAQLSQLIYGYRISQTIGVAAELGIADFLANGPKSSTELAQATGSQPRALYRLLRALASVGVFTEVEPERFGLTPMAEALQTDAPGSQRGMARHSASDSNWRAWGQCGHSVRSGQSAFEHVHGMEVWDYREQHPEANAIFNAAMTSGSALQADAIAAAYDFSGFGTLMDVAGGHGLLLTTILSANPTLRGILAEQPHVIASARPIVEQSGVADRCTVVEVDFFDSVPSSADAYIMKFIIHDWDDARALTILKNCRAAMGPNGTLLLAEFVIPLGDTPSPGKFMDVNMMVGTGGEERTEAEFHALFEAAGFRLTRIVPTRSPLSVIEGKPI
jgi:hypothetical protein